MPTTQFLYLKGGAGDNRLVSALARAFPGATKKCDMDAPQKARGIFR